MLLSKMLSRNFSQMARPGCPRVIQHTERGKHLIEHYYIFNAEKYKGTMRFLQIGSYAALLVFIGTLPHFYQVMGPKKVRVKLFDTETPPAYLWHFTKEYPWGGTHSLFWNPKTNYDENGYTDEFEELPPKE